MLRPLALLTALAAAPASAAPSPAWLRLELAGAGLATSGQSAHLVEFDAYYARYGLGAGVGVWEAEFGAWDVPRSGRNDASAHMLSTFFPLKAYATLWSFEGPPLYAQRHATRTIGRVEAFGVFSDWAKLGLFTEPRIGVLGDEDRVGVKGSLPARRIDYGVRFDYGRFVGIAVGRREFWSERSGDFRRRYDAMWYGRLVLYYGFNIGDQSGSLLQLPRDVRALLRKLLRRKPKYQDIILE